MISRRNLLQAGSATAVLLASHRALADQAPGVTDSEIKIGQTVPYSGPASAYAAVGKAEAAVFKMVNDQGGVNGRKINLLSIDDGYSPPKTFEQTRRLVEQDEVACIFSSVGTPCNSAIRDYLNDNRVPQLFVATGASKFCDPERYPWTIGWQPSYSSEAAIFAAHILENRPTAKIGVLYQNDDFGKEYLSGLKASLGDKADLVVKEATYTATQPTVDSQIVTLQASGADTLVIAATPKFAAQALRKAYDIDWRPVEYLTNVSFSIGSVMKSAGAEKCVCVMCGAYLKDPTDPKWKDDAGMNQWRAFMDKYLPGADMSELDYVAGFAYALTMVQVLKQCGHDLSRERMMREAANIRGFETPVFLPGVKIDTSPTNYYPIRQMQFERFNGTTTELFGEVLSG
jgi:branched-chain amino acid transport system substrate-binding protein